MPVGDPVERYYPADRTVVLDEGRLPFEDEQFDMIVADYVFEHLDDPGMTARELDRVLRPAGWICGRTPNRWGYVSMATRLIPNRRHTRILARAQPDREAIDVFPTRFRINTMGAVSTAFPSDRYDNYSYRYEAEPAYYFGSSRIFRAMKAVNTLSPSLLASNIFVFVRKRQFS